MKFFNTAGPINPEKHYYVASRFHANHIFNLIEQEKYFILHAPRQSGKTTELLRLTKELNASEKYSALYINVEPAQVARSNINMGMEIILKRFRNAAEKTYHSSDPIFGIIEACLKSISGNSLCELLQQWSRSSEKPIILFIDEIDSLIGDTLISTLRQLRADYEGRPKNFPQSVCLVGVRDVRDYQIWSEKEQSMILGGSAFNIKAESLTIPNFSLEQVTDLYNQHTQATGQVFEPEATLEAFRLTQGQPWLVNALAYQACFVDVTDRTQPITKEVIERAKETLILRRDTHIDQLVHKLKEPRVRKIVDQIISGNSTDLDFSVDDISYVTDLGLICRDNQKNAIIANPIYREIIPRELSYVMQFNLNQQVTWYQDTDGSINMKKLLAAFQQFYRENSDAWLRHESYVESGPHIILMAFLQRIINGGGQIVREYALGRRRVDLLVIWPKQEAMQRIVIELKVYRDNQTKTSGLEQTWQYMQQVDATEGHLVIFNRRADKTWQEKIYQENAEFNNTKISVWGA